MGGGPFICILLILSVFWRDGTGKWTTSFKLFLKLYLNLILMFYIIGFPKLEKWKQKRWYSIGPIMFLNANANIHLEILIKIYSYLDY